MRRSPKKKVSYEIKSCKIVVSENSLRYTESKFFLIVSSVGYKRLQKTRILRFLNSLCYKVLQNLKRREERNLTEEIKMKQPGKKEWR